MQILSRLTLCCFILTSCLPAFALGTAFTYQGRLNDGTNLATGSYDLRFAIYDADSGGAQQGNLITNPATALNNGLFTVTLDFGNQFPGADRWLEIGVRTNGEEGFTTLWPRQALTPAPYALFAATANTLNGTLPAAQVTGLPTTNDYATHLYASNIAQEVYSSMSAISGYATRSQASNIAQEVYSLISGNIKFVGGGEYLGD